MRLHSSGSSVRHFLRGPARDAFFRMERRLGEEARCAPLPGKWTTNDASLRPLFSRL